MPRVFLSYIHDSPEHRARVLGLAERLRASGIDAWLDQYEPGTPAQTWPRWMLDELEKAAFVLVVSTETYYRRFRGHEVAGKGKGVDWEGALITQELHDAKSRTTRFVPVTLAAGLESFIPEPLRGRTFYELTSEARYADLVDFLHSRAGVEPAPLGGAVVAPRKRGTPLTFGDEEPLVDVGHLPSTILEKLIGREAELAELDAAWSSAEVRVLTVVAVGGAGKTALVHHWMQGFEQAGWKARGASAAFAWSFYSQGAGDDRQASGDVFIERALTHLGDPDPKEGSAHDRGTRLAVLVRRHRALLILDGLEPLQEPPSSAEAGKVKDPAVAALLRNLAADNPGLLVVTSRESVLDLSSREGRGARTLDLETLREEAGAALLRWLGVKGPEEELRAVSKDVHGHAFTLTLLGTYLRDAHEGDVRAWKDLSLLAAADLGGNPQASRMMAAYSSWFGTGPEQQILGLVGLFDRPAAADLVAALREKPAIPEVTDELIDLSEARWKVALSRLRKARLLLEEDAGALDAHPLVREHFGRRLRERHPDAWKAAHGRLFDHLKDTTEHWPDDLAGLAPLYQAVVHGCRAGRHQEACAGVYRDRILRGNVFYSAYKLGAFGADLGAVACFFDPPWTRVVPSLAEADQAWLLNEAAVRLRGLGRPTEAVEPMRINLAMRVARKEWNHAPSSAGNLSEMELTLGDVAAAVRDAEQSVVFADRSGDAFLRTAFRTTHADALHAAGRRDEALALFREAEAMQAEDQPEYPLLYSLQGFRYCDLLLAVAERAVAAGRTDDGARGACDEVERRALEVFRWRSLPRWNPRADPLLDVARDHLTRGRARLYRAILDGSAVEGAAPDIEHAVDGLRRAGTIHHIPRGLLTRAWLRAASGDPDLARADLDEAQEIAERGPMPLFLADINLYRARLFHDRAALAEARRLVEEHGYWRRREEIEDAEEAARSWPVLRRARAKPLPRRARRRASAPTVPTPPAAGFAPDPVAPSPSESAALVTWREKLAFLQVEEATTVDPDAKFRVGKLIAEARAKIREHGGAA